MITKQANETNRKKKAVKAGNNTVKKSIDRNMH